MAGISLNLDNIYALRKTLKPSYPDPAATAVLAELGNAEGIEVGLKEENSHIRKQDVKILRHIVQSRLILKIPPTPEMIGTVLDIKPDLAVLVPENFNTIFSKSHTDNLSGSSDIPDAVKTIKENGIPACILIEPDPDQLKVVHRLNVSMVEIYSGTFCGLKSTDKKIDSFNHILNTVKLANKLKIGIRIGSGLCYKSIKSFRGLREIDEFSIGRSIIGRAVFTGMERAVKEMADLVRML